jgi:biotin carboxyl carrier protein
VDGKVAEVDIDSTRSTVRLSEATYPFRIVQAMGDRSEIEIAGENVLVEGWPEGLPAPSSPVAINGELVDFAIESRSISGDRIPSAPIISGPSAPLGAFPRGEERPERAGSGGVAIVPPMPGKILEVRVYEGQQVRQGEVVLVLEAMKMRNEVQSPLTGTVTRLTAKVGQNARAREPMLFVIPGKT